MAAAEHLPTLDELGRDLLIVPPWRKALCLAAPFALAAAFFIFASNGHWIPALACPVLLSFFTYGSISHDLVHKTLRLPYWLNEALLTTIELITLRSGHAYRVVHLHHHARFPSEDDLEGAASKMTWWRALIEGMTLQPRLWLFALRKAGPHRKTVLAEVAAIAVLLAASIVATRSTPLPAIYSALMVMGSWVFPFITAFIPHDAAGASALTQTRLYRGRVLSVLALEHLYHLEHHLYPMVPHQRWPELARRLDPHFRRLGVEPVMLLF